MTLGGGRNGNLVLAMEAAVYDNLSGTSYTRPTEPAPYATHGARQTAAAWTNSNTIHKEEWRIYDIVENIYNILKQGVVAAVGETYPTTKKQSHMGFHSVPEKELMDHLMERYRNIQASDIEV